MKITRIAKQEHRDRYNIFVDDRFFTALSAELVADAGIREGDDLAPGQLDTFIERDAAGKVLNQALRFLSIRPHSEHELRTKLGRKEIEPELVEDAFGRLRELGYLDDTAFAKQWVEERGTVRGTVMLKAELRRKGIADETVSEALAESEHDEISDAAALVAKRLSRVSGEPPAQVKQKLIRYLAGRGYPYDTARQAVESQLPKAN